MTADPSRRNRRAGEHDRGYPPAPEPPEADAPGYQPTTGYPDRHDETLDAGLAGLASGLNFLLGVWLVLVPFALDYDNTGGGFDGYWNDIVIGIAIALLALARISAPLRFAPMSWINVVLGGWLIIAPFALAYNAGADAPEAVWNDVVVGFLVLALAMFSALMGRRGAKKRHAQSPAPRVP